MKISIFHNFPYILCLNCIYYKTDSKDSIVLCRLLSCLLYLDVYSFRIAHALKATKFHRPNKSIITSPLMHVTECYFHPQKSHRFWWSSGTSWVVKCHFILPVLVQNPVRLAGFSKYAEWTWICADRGSWRGRIWRSSLLRQVIVL